MSHALIIEDELLLAFAVEEALRELGYRAFEIARSVRDAVDSAERQCPDLIVANHQIIDGTGTDAVLAICSGKAIPVVFVTGSGPEIRLRLPDALIVEKPLSQRRLSDAVQKALESPFEHFHDSPERSNLN